MPRKAMTNLSLSAIEIKSIILANVDEFSTLSLIASQAEGSTHIKRYAYTITNILGQVTIIMRV